MARAHPSVYSGKRKRTPGGLERKDLVKNKRGRVVSKKKSRQGQKNSWPKACKQARKELGVEGFVPVGGRTREGKELHRRATKIHQSGKSGRRRR